MASFNKVVLLGNLTRDPEMRYLQKGTAIAQIGLAVNRKWSDNGETKEEVSFIDCTAWGKTAEIAAKYCKKGQPLMIEGRLKMDQWDDKQSGQKRSKLGVVIESLVLLGGGRSNQSEPAATAPAASEPSAAQPTEDDVPF